LFFNREYPNKAVTKTLNSNWKTKTQVQGSDYDIDDTIRTKFYSTFYIPAP
jgi:hypothetical protein